MPTGLSLSVFMYVCVFYVLYVCVSSPVGQASSNKHNDDGEDDDYYNSVDVDLPSKT